MGRTPPAPAPPPPGAGPWRRQDATGSPLRAPDLVARFFGERGARHRHIGEPSPPSTASGLYMWSGYTAGHARQSENIRKARGLETWERTIIRQPDLRSWLEGDESWVAPEAWPLRWARVLPQHVTPLVWALNILPQSKDERRSAIVWRLPEEVQSGLAKAAAWAHGWTMLRDTEIEGAVPALRALQETLPFALWAYPVDLDALALPVTEGSKSGPHPRPFDLFDAYQARVRMVRDPLILNKKDLRLALPDWAQDWDNFHFLPRVPFDPVGRSSRTPLLAATSTEPRRPPGPPSTAPAGLASGRGRV